MGTTNSNILPATTGLNLGSSVQRWNGFFQSLNVLGSGLSTVAFSATPVFDGSLGNIFQLTLTGNATATIVNLTAGKEYTFIITQDGAGSRTFAWPVTVHGGMVVDPTPSVTSVQKFVTTDGVNLFPLTEGVSAL